MIPARIIFSITLLFAAVFLTVSPVLAQGVDQMAVNLEIKDSTAKEGNIVSVNKGVFSLSSNEYDSGVYGVITSDPALALNKATTNTHPVLTSGPTMVLVSSNNGRIKRGDLITTSNSKGIGQKATKSGHVLGKALEDAPSGKDVSLIAVFVSINYNAVSAQAESLTAGGINQLTQKLSSAFLKGSLPDIFKYIFAILLGTISFFLGISHFVRSNRTAVEAIARNPLAKVDINRQMWIGNIAIVAVCGAGLASSLLILFFL